jgi:apolipoprotein N-acyltransferase
MRRNRGSHAGRAMREYRGIDACIHTGTVCIAVTLRGLPQAIVLAQGWRRALLAFGAGVASVLALPPFHLWPLLFVTFPVLVWLLDGSGGGLRGIWRAALTGWLFGFGYLLAGLYWLGHAFLVDAQTFGWMLPFAVLTVPAGLAIFPAAGTALTRLLWTRGAVRILALAVALTATEWLRGNVLTGFPWNTFGYALTAPLALAQGAALVGIWGLTFLAIAAFASPATLADERADTNRPWLPVTLAIVVLAALAVYGTLRLARTPTAFVPGVQLRIMQPNLQQDEKFDYTAKDQVMKHYLDLSRRVTGAAPRGLADVTHLIWPESAFPFYLLREPDALAQIGALLPEGAVLITGADRIEDPRRGENPRIYNSIMVLDHNGSVVAVYDKVHLVPFGEYLPFQTLLERIGFVQLTKVEGGYLAGEPRRALVVPRAAPLLPLLCYEIIFPGEIMPRGERPGWLVNLTNDGWFGISSGPYQHLEQARLRAIETGLPLVRAANTGISAVIDPLGRTLESLPLGAEGLLDAPLPQPVAPPLYARVGDIPAGTVVLLTLAVLAGLRLRERRTGATAKS